MSDFKIPHLRNGLLAMAASIDIQRQPLIETATITSDGRHKGDVVVDIRFADGKPGPAILLLGSTATTPAQRTEIRAQDLDATIETLTAARDLIHNRQENRP